LKYENINLFICEDWGGNIILVIYIAPRQITGIL